MISKFFKALLLITAIAFGTANAMPTTTQYCNNVLSYGNPSMDATVDLAKPNLYLCRLGYVSAYSYTTKQPVWVAYTTQPRTSNDRVERRDTFRPDPDVPSQFSAQLSDYRGSGYDRGHLLPFATVNYDGDKADQSFYLSNIAPQHAGLNRQGWAQLESYERFWNSYYKGIYVITGGIYKKKQVNQTIGANKVAVPDYFFKIIYAPNKFRDPKAIAFVMPNDRVARKDVAKYRVSIENIEQRTGLSFLNNVQGIDKKQVSPMWRLPSQK